MNKFSSTEIHILENGLRWIKETKYWFGDKFYLLLLREHPEVNPLLQSIDPWSFNKEFVQALDTVIGEIRAQGDVITPLNDFWPELSITAMVTLEPSDLIKIAETFLDLISELAEDAWRKAIKTVMSTFVRTGTDPSTSFFRSNCTVFPFFKGKASVMDQPRMLCLGSIF
jgi:hypothetical protein